jgi:hypothetical protein
VLYCRLMGGKSTKYPEAERAGDLYAQGIHPACAQSHAAQVHHNAQVTHLTITSLRSSIHAVGPAQAVRVERERERNGVWDVGLYDSWEHGNGHGERMCPVQPFRGMQFTSFGRPSDAHECRTPMWAVGGAHVGVVGDLTCWRSTFRSLCHPHHTGSGHTRPRHLGV